MNAVKYADMPNLALTPKLPTAQPISKGIRKMPGYAGQIKARDRWAIVAYVRALQRSQNATIELVPEDMRGEILKRKSEIDKKLAEQAEAERKAEQENAKK